MKHRHLFRYLLFVTSFAALWILFVLVHLEEPLSGGRDVMENSQTSGADDEETYRLLRGLISVRVPKSAAENFVEVGYHVTNGAGNRGADDNVFYIEDDVSSTVDLKFKTKRSVVKATTRTAVPYDRKSVCRLLFATSGCRMDRMRPRSQDEVLDWDRGWIRHGYFVNVSESLPLDRRLPDTRPSR